MGTAKTVIDEFDPDRVKPLPDQPRKRFRGIRELADSIREVGQTAPGLVVPLVGDDKYLVQLVDGERRLRACKLAGVKFRAEVRETPSASALDDLFVTSFAANFGKQHHDAIEIACGLARLQKQGKTIEQMCRIAGKSTAWVSGHLSLLKLHPSVQQMMLPAEGKKNQRTGKADSGRLNYSLAQLLHPLDEAKQISLANKITRQGMSLSAARRLVLQTRSKAGEKNVHTHAGGPKRSIATVESILEDFSNRIGVYIDMPGAEITALIDTIPQRQLWKIVEKLEGAVENLEGLADLMQSRLPSGKK